MTRNTTATRSFRETAGVLALFALALNLLAGLMPISAAFGIAAADPASLCRADGPPPNGANHGPGHDHGRLCCITHTLNGSALIPAAAAVTQAIFVATATVTRDQAAIDLRLHVNSRPRAPPLTV